ncbi:ABC transporter [Acidipropionibacterium jensenii]|uniref:Transport permease protein n=1 Tax=Acidipropionibacterium jensenii TaxID=1749 RepID=A0A3T0S0D4_9ACTN|nr:ABC transporter permease [Acidipropionibacterium jensenii]AZZ39793.1 ABC transporter [Acidipropionibacterium jensenii]
MTTRIHDAGSEIAQRGTPLRPDQMAARMSRRGIWQVARWQLLAMRSWTWSLIIESIGQPLLYMVAMGVGLGTLISANGRTVDGVSYLVFVAPAIMVLTATMSAATEFSYPVMRGFRWDRLYQGPAATPVTPAQIALGHHLAVMIRFLGQAVVFWLIMLAFGAAPGPWSWLCVPITMLSASAFGALLQGYAAGLDSEGEEFTFVLRFVVIPLVLFSGTYFPLSSMPGYLQWIGWISPIWHGTQLAREVSYGAGEPGWLIGVHLVVLAGLSAAGMVWACRNYTRKLVQ